MQFVTSTSCSLQIYNTDIDIPGSQESTLFLSSQNCKLKCKTNVTAPISLRQAWSRVWWLSWLCNRMTRVGCLKYSSICSMHTLIFPRRPHNNDPQSKCLARNKSSSWNQGSLNIGQGPIKGIERILKLENAIFSHRDQKVAKGKPVQLRCQLRKSCLIAQAYPDGCLLFINNLNITL